MTDRDVTIERFLDRSLTPRQCSDFLGALSQDPQSVDELVDSVTVDELLSERAERIRDAASAGQAIAALAASWQIDRPEVKSAGPTSTRGGRIALRTVAVGTLIAIICTAVVLIGRGVYEAPQPVPTRTAVALFSRSSNVEWLADAHRWSVRERIYESDWVQLNGGRAEIVFHCGAVLTLTGPAALEIRSSKVVSLSHGTVTTRAQSPESREFRVVTPAMDVIDVGTEFGVKVDSSGETDVVVFDGEVRLVLGSGDRRVGPEAGILTSGQAVRVSQNGVWSRIVSVRSDIFPIGDAMFSFTRRRLPIITGISDDRRSPSSPKFYRICHEGLDEDVPAFVDRVYEWNGVTAEGIPGFLRGADYVQTFNDDKDDGCPLITVEVSGPCMLYLFYDDRLDAPDWLRDDFEDTGLDIGIDETPRTDATPHSLDSGPGNSIDRVSSIWRRRIEAAGTVELGRVGGVGVPNAPLGLGSKRTMFGIAAQPLTDRIQRPTP